MDDKRRCVNFPQPTVTPASRPRVSPRFPAGDPLGTIDPASLPPVPFGIVHYGYHAPPDITEASLSSFSDGQRLLLVRLTI